MAWAEEDHILCFPQVNPRLHLLGETPKARYAFVSSGLPEVISYTWDPGMETVRYGLKYQPLRNTEMGPGEPGFCWVESYRWGSLKDVLGD